MIGKVFPAYSEYKDSGIDWLGEIPKHWESVRLRFLCSTMKGAPFKSSEFTDSGVPIVKVSDFEEESLVQDKKLQK